MRVLVTGHNGYIGSVMTGVLQMAGHSVVGFDTYYYADCTLGTKDKDIIAIRKDIRDVVPDDLIGFDAIIHLAALSNDPLGELKSEWTYEINHLATVKLAEVARDAGVQRFLYSSSCSIYGGAGDDFVTEEAPLSPLTHYAISKVRAEEDLNKLASQDFSPIFLRNATVYGVSPRMRVDLVLNNLVGWAYTTGKVLIMSDGTPWRPIVHVEDVSCAFAAVLSAPRESVHSQAFNVGRNAENYQVRELAQIVKETVPDCSIEYARQAGPDARSYRVDFNKLARQLPGLELRWNAWQGVQELYEAYRQTGFRPQDLQERKFVRLNQLKHLIDNERVDKDLRWKNQFIQTTKTNL